MWSVMLPLARPAMVIAAMRNLVSIRNHLLFPLVFAQDDNWKALPQAPTTFMGDYRTNRGVLFEALTLGAVTTTLLNILLSRQSINGMTQGALK
jgi:raffinose/stachyose/melibiose transport system permease protein